MKNNTCVSMGLVLALGGIVLVAQQPNMVQTHIGHVTDAFDPTPNKQGLLPTAAAEAKTAAQHASLALKAPDNLDALKLHAGHVINAIDPTVEPKGPGLGYGVKKAAAGAAQHIELAAKVDGASANVKTHSAHVAAASNSVVKRSDDIVAMAQKVRSATSAADAAKLMTEVSAATEQLTAGADVNKDGRIGWDAPEGGLQQAQQHMDLMKKGESQ